MYSLSVSGALLANLVFLMKKREWIRFSLWTYPSLESPRNGVLRCGMYLPTPSSWAECDSCSVFKQSLTEISFSYIGCSTKNEGPNLPYYLAIAKGISIWFKFFARVLALCELQIASSKIRTRVGFIFFTKIIVSTRSLLKK